MAKSREFILKRYGKYCGDSRICVLRYLSGKPVRLLNISKMHICHQVFSRLFGISLKRGEIKRIKITIEEVK